MRTCAKIYVYDAINDHRDLSIQEKIAVAMLVYVKGSTRRRVACRGATSLLPSLLMLLSNDTHSARLTTAGLPKVLPPGMENMRSWLVYQALVITLSSLPVG